MALPSTFPKVPVPPPSTVAMTDPRTGLPTTEWLGYFQAVQRFQQAVRDRLDAKT